MPFGLLDIRWPKNCRLAILRLDYGGGPQTSMSVITIPRHGNRPVAIPRDWPVSQRLPGAINVGFFDGHAEKVPLERLWQLYWHKGYEPPAKRPGLK